MESYPKFKMSVKQYPTYLNTLALFLTGLGIFLIYRNLTKATPKNSLWIKLSKYRKYSSFIEAQAQHETANYSSDVYKRANNLFGMKNAQYGRKESQLGKAVTGDDYRHYSNNGESLRDLIQWLKFNNAPTNLATYESYVRYLKEKGYFTAPISEYLKGVNYFLNKA